MTPRLLKVIVQPVYIAEVDGELIEHVAQPLPLSAAVWKALDPARFAADGAAALAGALSSPEGPPPHS